MNLYSIISNVTVFPLNGWGKREKTSLSSARVCTGAWEQLTVIGGVERYHRHSDDSQEQNQDREADLQGRPLLSLLWLWSADVSYIHLTF